MNIRGINLIVFLSFLLLAVSVHAQKKELDKGVSLYREGNFAAAADVLEKVSIRGKSNRLKWAYLGASYLKLDRIDDAKKVFGNISTKEVDGSDKTSKKLPSLLRNNQDLKSSGQVEAGIIYLIVELKSDATVGFVFPLLNDNANFERQAVEAAKKMKFEPKSINDVLVTSVVTVYYTFTTY